MANRIATRNIHGSITNFPFCWKIPDENIHDDDNMAVIEELRR